MVADSPAVRQLRTANGSVGSFLTWLQAELAPFPGRGSATIRMVVACLVVVTISMALQLPQAYFSAFFVFFVPKEDMVTTAITGVALTVAIIAGFGLTLLAFLITVDYPSLRVALMAALFCAAMYGLRVLTIGPIAFGAGFVVLISQQFVDLYREPEALVRGTLWSMVAMTFPIAVLLIANRFILPARPNILLRREAKLRLGFVIEALDRRVNGPIADPPLLFDASVIGTGRLLGLLKLSASDDSSLKERLPSYESILNDLNRLVETASMLNALQPSSDSPGLRSREKALSSTCSDLRRALDGDLDRFDASLRFQPAPGADGGAVASVLNEMERHVVEIFNGMQQLSEARSGPVPAARPIQPRHPVVSDALTNPVYLQYALKVTFAAMLCYFAYTGFDWPGIHTCVITCAVVALTSTGATIHKASLRLAGALIGGGLALLATVFIVPHLESIGQLLLLVAPVAALAAWVTNGSERTSYCGVQVAFAFFFCVLQGFAPNADVTFVRDRLVGIVLGISVMALVFSYVWPERVEQQMRAALAKVVRTSVALLKRHGGLTRSAASPAISAERTVLFEKLALSHRLAAVAQFEPPSLVAVKPSRSDADLVNATQATALGALKLAVLREAGSAETAERATHVLKAFENAIAALLQAIADRLEAGAPGDDLLDRAACTRFSKFEQAHKDRLAASDCGPGVVYAFDDLLARVTWLAGPPGRSVSSRPCRKA